MLEFAAWAPTEADFWADWIDARICTAPHKFTAEFPGVYLSDQTTQGWVPRDADGQPVVGWHVNVRITDAALIEQFSQGLRQTDEAGNLLPLFERTHAAAVFGLTLSSYEEASGFPPSYRSARNVRYCDIRDISTPANVWA